MAITNIEADYEKTDFKIGIVVAQWNSFITDPLLNGAIDVLKSKGYTEEQIIVVHCPGAYEISLAAQKLLQKVDGVIALGAVIQGDTPHFDYVCTAVNNGIAKLNLNTNKPVSFGILTTDNVDQARERAGLIGDKGNKGAEAALALLDMLSIIEKIDKL
ncbi:MAG: 6,7-dimethyl-8-ribityllumazine synthase [Balneolaceae bacterium]|nr:6,7-dimethyl-8-ribityllumazine synthase [Balneolaceae bacterium]